uniref:WD_REPEATS_REGION domain-containing protein n=1 Tax=Steinernema glaseri TaxID=37863 RepID=A0A1I7ZE06_9BILA
MITDQSPHTPRRRPDRGEGDSESTSFRETNMPAMSDQQCHSEIADVCLSDPTTRSAEEPQRLRRTTMSLPEESPEKPRLKYTIINPAMTRGKMPLCSSDDDVQKGSPKPPKSRGRYRPFDSPRSPIPKESYPAALQKPQYVLPPPAPEGPLITIDGISTDAKAKTRSLVQLGSFPREEDGRKKSGAEEEQKFLWESFDESMNEVDDYALPSSDAIVLGASADGKPIHLAMCIDELNHVVLVLTHDVSVEISANRQVRMCIQGKAACTMDEEGRATALHHPKIGLIQDGTNMLLDVRDGPKIRADDNAYIHVWSSQQKSNPMVYSIRGEDAKNVEAHRDFSVAADNFCLRTESDFSVGLFLCSEGAGLQTAAINEANRRQALYSIRTSRFIQNGEFVMYLVGGVKVRHSLLTGDTRVYVSHNFMSLKRHSLAATIQSPFIDFTIDRAWQFRVVLGDRCIETKNDKDLVVTAPDGVSHVFDLVDVAAVDCAVDASVYCCSDG